MAIIPLYLRRPSAILRIPDAIARGLTQAGFIRELERLGLTYRTILMQRDYNSGKGAVEKQGWLKSERRNVIIPPQAIADVHWELSQEYMYKAGVWSRLHPGEPLTERFVNLMSDVPLTPAQIEEQIYSRWGEWEKYSAEELERVEPETGYHRVPSPLEEE